MTAERAQRRGYNAAGAWLDEFAKWPKPDEVRLAAAVLAREASLRHGEEAYALGATRHLRPWDMTAE
jgi:hypothetical protein